MKKPPLSKVTDFFTSFLFYIFLFCAVSLFIGMNIMPGALRPHHAELSNTEQMLADIRFFCVIIFCTMFVIGVYFNLMFEQMRDELEGIKKALCNGNPSHTGPDATETPMKTSPTPEPAKKEKRSFFKKRKRIAHPLPKDEE